MCSSCVLLFKVLVMFKFYAGKYLYKVCGYPYCNDTNSESEITSDIDVNSLVIINEYVFVQVSNNFICNYNYTLETGNDNFIAVVQEYLDRHTHEHC